MNKDQKSNVVSELEKKFKTASAFYLTDFTGINVQKMQDLRRKFRETDSEYRVVKNTLAKIALKNAGLNGELEQHFEGPTGIAFGFEDPIGPAKVIKDFISEKENQSFKVKVFVLENELYEANRLSDIAKMPNKQELLGQLVGLLSSPLQNLAMLLSSPMQNVVGMLNSLKDTKES